MNDIEILEDLVNHIRFDEPAHYGVGLYFAAIESILKERQADKEKIKELETINKMQEYRINEMDIPKSKVREKMEKDIKTNEHVILGGRRNGKTLEYGRRLGRIEICEELLNNKTS